MNFAQLIEALTLGIKSINHILWDYILIILLVGTGIYFTIVLGGVQVRTFGKGMKTMFGGIRIGKKKAGRRATKSGITSFQALTTAVAAQVGTGNIAGAATAIVSGGPGAIFWMWVSAFFGMATIYAETLLAQKTRVKKDGQLLGGPAYYIKARFKGHFGTFLSTFFSVATILALGFMGNMVQANSISQSLQNSFKIKPLITGQVRAVVTGIVFFGGIKRIARITERSSPLWHFFT